MTIAEAFKKFEKVQNRLERFGATDSEPDAVMQVAVVRALKLGSKPYKEPESVDDWELYDVPGAGTAASRLTKALRTLIEDLKAIEPEIEDMRDVCWRVSF